MSPRIRAIEADELHSWVSVARSAMVGTAPEPDEVEAREKAWDLDRCFASFDDAGTLCGTARTFATELTVPGAILPAGAVSGVGVLTTHRRQGRLTSLMQAQLADSIERGEAVSVLVAAEYPIYGRYGYGPGTEACVMWLETPAIGGWVESTPTGRTEFVDTDTFLPELLGLYDRTRKRNVGHITYHDSLAEILVGLQPGIDDAQRRQKAPKVVWRDDAGAVQGVAMYSIDDVWEHNRPRCVLTVDVLVTATDEAERELVRFLASVDWVHTVKMSTRPLDDPLPLMLGDGRAATLGDRSDHVWTRILDVPTALGQRTYATSGRLVLDVVDPGGFATGRFALDASPEGAECRPTSESADLVVPASALGAAYLGGHPWGQLAAAGWLQEERDGAVATASALFGTPRSPWCAFTF